jgi:hypothetical protein
MKEKYHCCFFNMNFIIIYSPICASMPWGDKERVSTNVYQHIVGRHRFDYGKIRQNLFICMINIIF